MHEESSAPGTGTGDWPSDVVHCRRQGRMGRSGTPPAGVSVGVDAAGAASQARRWEEKGAARARRVGWKGRAPHGGELRRRQSGGVMDVALPEGTGDEQTLPLTQEAWRQVNHHDRDPAAHCGRICVVGSRKYIGVGDWWKKLRRVAIRPWLPKVVDWPAPCVSEFLCALGRWVGASPRRLTRGSHAPPSRPAPSSCVGVLPHTSVAAFHFVVTAVACPTACPAAATAEAVVAAAGQCRRPWRLSFTCNPRIGWGCSPTPPLARSSTPFTVRRLSPFPLFCPSRCR